MLKLVHAGRLATIEEALAGRAWAAGVQAERAGASKASASRSPNPSADRPPPRRPLPRLAPPVPAVAGRSSWRDRLHAKLLELGMTFTADAIEHSQVTEANGELQFMTPEEFSSGDERQGYSEARAEVAGPADENQGQRSATARSRHAALKPSRQAEDEVSERALSHPEVQRFQELFPDAQVRTVRNLKE